MNNELEKLVPGEEDENVGGEPPKKKKEKKRKSKEERVADRRIIFWVMIIVVIITGFFYVYPIIKGEKEGFDLKKENSPANQKPGSSTLWKGYTEIKF